MNPALQREIVSTIGAALVTAMVADLLRRTVGPASIAVIGPIVLVMAQQLLDQMASHFVRTVVGVTA